MDVCATAGSPFTVKVTGEGRIKESITRKRQASSLASVGSTCGLNLKIPGEKPEIFFPASIPASELPGSNTILQSPPTRKLVPDGFGPGEVDQDVHPQ